MFNKKKKQEKEAEPQYYSSVTSIPTLNYKVYYMKPLEKALYFLGAFVVGALVGFLFYGGIGKDSYGNPTTVTYVMNVIVIVGAGCLTGKLYLPIRTEQIMKKRIKELKLQFRDMLDGITTSIGAGNNVRFAFNAVYEDLQIQYPSDAFIIQELEVIISGMESNFKIEDLLDDFAERSGIDDIKSFANVFRICNSKGGNMQSVIRNTHDILSQKMNIIDEIETTVAGSKMNQSMMIVLPIAIVAVIKMMSPEFGSYFVKPSGLISTTIAIVLFVIAHKISKSILDIKV